VSFRNFPPKKTAAVFSSALPSMKDNALLSFCNYFKRLLLQKITERIRGVVGHRAPGPRQLAARVLISSPHMQIPFLIHDNFFDRKICSERKFDEYFTHKY